MEQKKNQIYAGTKRLWPFFVGAIVFSGMSEAYHNIWLYMLAKACVIFLLYFFGLRMANKGQGNRAEMQFLWLKPIQTLGVWVGVITTVILSGIKIWNHQGQGFGKGSYLSFLFLWFLLLELMEGIMTGEIVNHKNSLSVSILEVVIVGAIIILLSRNAFDFVISCFVK